MSRFAPRTNIVPGMRLSAKKDADACTSAGAAFSIHARAAVTEVPLATRPLGALVARVSETANPVVPSLVQPSHFGGKAPAGRLSNDSWTSSNGGEVTVKSSRKTIPCPPGSRPTPVRPVAGFQLT